MLEIILSSFAGLATAAALKRFPKSRKLISMGASSHIQSQINLLKAEKEILTKTISRLYQHDVGLTKIQKDKLLARYQHQLGVVLAKIEKLEEASKHPDLGPVGDGLITLMDQKLSQLDQRLYELSSKIAVANVQSPQIKEKPKSKIQTTVANLGTAEIIIPKQKSQIDINETESPKEAKQSTSLSDDEVDDTDELESIKQEIMKTLSKLDEAEVE